MSNRMPIEPNHNLGPAPRGTHWELEVSDSGATFPVAVPDIDSQPLSAVELAYRMGQIHAEIRGIGRA